MSDARTGSPQAAPKITTAVEADVLLALIAAESALKGVREAKMNRALEAIRTKFGKEIAALDAGIAEKLEVLEDWAEENRKEFGEKKSIDLLHGTVGFRFGKAHLETLSKVTWKKVLGKLRGRFAKYVRTKKEPDKAALLADATKAEDPLKAADLSRLGLRLAQEENFFFELKKD